MKTNTSPTLFGASPIAPQPATLPQLRYIQGLLAQCHKINVTEEDWKKVESVQFQFNMHNEGRQDMSKSSATLYIGWLKTTVDKAKKQKE